MADMPDGPTLDPRLRDFLDAELRQAEADFARLPLPAPRRAIATPRIATLLVAAIVLLVVAVGGSQLLGKPNSGQAAIPLGTDGLPTSIGGEPVLRVGDISQRSTSAGAFLAGGVFTLASDPCPDPAGPSAAPCAESWALADPAAAAGARFGLRDAAGAPGFVRTSGALTVVRVEAVAATTPDASPCAGCAGTLTVNRVVWRQPTKGPMPPDASPPQGGPVFNALVPDFVAATTRDGTGIAGYVPKAYLIGPFPDMPGTPSNPPQEPPTPVYAADLTTLVGHMVAGVGFVALGETPPPDTSHASVAPASPSVAPSPPPSSAPSVDCERIAAAPCERAVELARTGHETEVGAATQVVVDDACPPLAVCDRANAFDAIVVFVTAGPDTTGWSAFEVTGAEVSAPAKAQPWLSDLPTHIAQRVWAVTHPAASGAPTPSPLPSLLTSPPPGQMSWFEKASLSPDGRRLTLDFTGGRTYAPSDPCSRAYQGWAEAAGDTLYAAVVDVTERVRPPAAATPQACDAVGHGRSVTVVLAAPFTGARIVDLAGYVHFLRAPAGLVRLGGLPTGWALRSQRDVEESHTGRWLRVYAPDANPPEGTSKGRLELYQAFGAPADVSGGTDVSTVSVGGQPATLYRSAADGELVLVWSLGSDGLALVANEADFTVDALVRLAESATPP